MENINNPALAAAVERMVRDRFTDAAIERVIVTQDFDEDNEPIVDVMVIFKAKPDVSRIKGLARNIWADLTERGSVGFPLLSFRSVAEHAKLTRAAA